jgi:hypothetical protein
LSCATISSWQHGRSTLRSNPVDNVLQTGLVCAYLWVHFKSQQASGMRSCAPPSSSLSLNWAWKFHKKEWEWYLEVHDDFDERPRGGRRHSMTTNKTRLNKVLHISAGVGGRRIQKTASAICPMGGFLLSISGKHKV